MTIRWSPDLQRFMAEITPDSYFAYRTLELALQCLASYPEITILPPP